MDGNWIGGRYVTYDGCDTLSGLLDVPYCGADIGVFYNAITLNNVTIYQYFLNTLGILGFN